MKTPRTVDEIADQLLPADGDGLHERALCLLLAEHERAIAELRARCEPGEEGREGTVRADAVSTGNSVNVRSSDQRAPGSTPAPTTEEVANDIKWLTDDVAVKYSLEDFGGAQYLAPLICRLRLLTADRDRLERSAKSYQWDAQRHAHAEDALARRIEAMAAREPTAEDLSRIVTGTPIGGMLMTPEMRVAVNRELTELCNAWRDRLLATPASEPSEGPKPRMVGFNEGPSTPVARLMPEPQPSPATPSAEDISECTEWVRRHEDLSTAEEVGERLAHREAGLQGDLNIMRLQRDAASAQLAQLDPERERRIAALVAACENDGEVEWSLHALVEYERTRKEAKS
jgi:hypothetical protein